MRPLRNRFVLHGPVVLLAALGLFSQYVYVERSSGEPGRGGSGLVEVQGASATGLVEELLQDARRTGASTRFLLDTTSTVLAKIESAALEGHPLVFSSGEVFSSVVGTTPAPAAVALAQRLGISLINPSIDAYAELLRENLKRAYFRENFPILPDLSAHPDSIIVRQADVALRALPAARIVLLTDGPAYTVLNRGSQALSAGRDRIVESSLTRVHNHLAFQTSELSKPAGYGDPSKISLHQTEPDLAYPESTMAGLGRYALFEVLNPSATARVSLTLSRSYMFDGDSSLPPAVVLGSAVTALPFTGRGSGRVFSAPLRVRDLHGRYYLGVDLRRIGTSFADTRKGLMFVFGGNVSMDSRQLVGFTRDISLVSEPEYAALTAPAFVERFPQDLANAALEYSGLYEDGWVAESCYLKLKRPGLSALRVTGMTPAFPGSGGLPNKIRILEDGVPRIEKDLQPGSFDLRMDRQSDSGTHRVEIQFFKAQRLSAEDVRPASALLAYVGYDAKPVNAAGDLADVTVVSIGKNWFPLEHAQNQTFRWVSNDAEIDVEPNPAGRAVLRMEAEPGPSQGLRKLNVAVLDGAGKRVTNVAFDGRQVQTFALPASSHTATPYYLHVEPRGGPVAGDGRVLNLRVFRIGASVEISSPGSGIEFGRGWYEVEAYAGATFRWAAAQAELSLLPAGRRGTLIADLEPNSGGQPVTLQILDSQGHILLKQRIAGRSALRIPLAGDGPSGATLVFKMDRQFIRKAAQDPRELAFRVFRFNIE